VRQELPMPWERRGRKLVYYRAKKVAGRVVRTYCGSGERAEQAAAEDLRRRLERQAANDAWRGERDRLEAVESNATALDVAALAAARAHLILGGYHRHARGCWRRRGGT
jgi:hypothetical protein